MKQDVEQSIFRLLQPVLDLEALIADLAARGQTIRVLQTKLAKKNRHSGAQHRALSKYKNAEWHEANDPKLPVIQPIPQIRGRRIRVAHQSLEA